MTFYEKLSFIWKKNNSLVCIGLDPDSKKLPACVKNNKHPIFAFNKSIIDKTHDLVCAYKPQIAYYSAVGAEDQLSMTIEHIHRACPHIPVILDAKRGDIGATAQMYAVEAFDRYKADAVTVNPYMGGDTLQPFTDRKDKGVIILCRTSNPGSGELQDLKIDGKEIFRRIALLASTKWNYNNNVLLVVGATFPQQLREIRALCPAIPFLVPGIGAQGGDVEQTIKNGIDIKGAGLIINSSRGIIYASTGKDFAETARKAAMELRDEINQYRA